MTYQIPISASLSASSQDKDSAEKLANLLKTCKRILESEEGLHSNKLFLEMSKILITKISCENESGYELSEILSKEGKNQVILKFNKLLKQAKENYGISDSELENRLAIKSQDSLLRISLALKDIKLTKLNRDINGLMYEIFLKSNQRGGLGQFFTPDEIIQFMINIANPKKDSAILDPACGSGRFLLTAFDKSQGINKNVYGIEVDKELSLLAKLNFIRKGINASNIINTNTLSDFKQTHALGDKFDIILTNPPFSFNYSNQEVLDKYELGKGKKSEQVDVLFVEKCLSFLKNTGKLLIVLPEGLLNLQKYKYFRDYIVKNSNVVASISLPAGSFMSFGESNAKTSILFLSKKKHQKALFAVVKSIGFEVGKKIYKPNMANDLNKVADLFLENDYVNSTLNNGVKLIWVDSAKINSERFDAGYFLSKNIANESMENGAFIKLSDIAQIEQTYITPSKHPDKIFNYLEVPDISEFTGSISNIRKVPGKNINGRKMLRIF